MNTDKEKRLDDLFKKKLDDPVDEIRYEEGDWDSLEQMMEKPKRRAIVYWLPILSSVAALLLLFLGWWTFKPQTITKPIKNQLQAVQTHKNIDSITALKATQQQASPIQKVQSTINYAATAGRVKRVKVNNGGALNTSPVNNGHIVAVPNNQQANNQLGSDPDKMLVAVKPEPVYRVSGIDAKSISLVSLKRPVYNSGSLLSKGKNGLKVKPPYHSQYALSVLAAPDVNGVGSSFTQGKVGTNIGLMFSAGIARKLTISTGALYSVKPYSTSFGNYHTPYQFKVDPTSVMADCRMLDIPINIGYQVYNKHQNKISVGTGLSSYIMLHENYKFNYEYANTTGPVNYIVPNSNKYFFGVLNLNATYQHQVNSKVGISIQPYVKLPLTNIGYSQVKLQTTGVAIGLTWNLNSLTKP
ncbi:hypothetical protein [Mucilaginibacter sp.]|uniref:hypothetical protein n=1 Tax=Mucilaginibacter sp. TaxID=1882438 RepID=UPI003D10F6EE